MWAQEPDFGLVVVIFGAAPDALQEEVAVLSAVHRSFSSDQQELVDVSVLRPLRALVWDDLVGLAHSFEVGGLAPSDVAMNTNLGYSPALAADIVRIQIVCDDRTFVCHELPEHLTWDGRICSPRKWGDA